MNDQTIKQLVNTALVTMLQACGFEVRHNTVSGQHLVEGTIESATAFYTLTVAGADASWRDAAPMTQERFNEKMDALDAANPAPLAKLEESQPQR